MIFKHCRRREINARAHVLYLKCYYSNNFVGIRKSESWPIAIQRRGYAANRVITFYRRCKESSKGFKKPVEML